MISGAKPISTGSYASRFNDEKLAWHWQVDGSVESFNRLLHHLGTRSNFRSYFEEALRGLQMEETSPKGNLAVADIGAGVCWTSAIIAALPDVRIVYGVDPSDRRLERARFVVKHFGQDHKVRIIKGDFVNPNVPEPVDIVILCGSLHHCYDKMIPGLFSAVKKILKPGGKVLVANEHYVTWAWMLTRIISYFAHIADKKRYFKLSALRMPHPFDGEHWRTRKEVETIFKDNGFKAEIHVHEGDLCKDKPTKYRRAGWRYYYAILERVKGALNE